jgi:hypothetical protein
MKDEEFLTVNECHEVLDMVRGRKWTELNEHRASLLLSKLVVCYLLPGETWATASAENRGRWIERLCSDTIAKDLKELTQESEPRRQAYLFLKGRYINHLRHFQIMNNLSVSSDETYEKRIKPRAFELIWEAWRTRLSQIDMSPEPVPVILSETIVSVMASDIPKKLGKGRYLPSALPSIYGRDEDIRYLSDLIKDPNGRSVIALCDFRGSGKSELALAAAHKLLEEKEPIIEDVFWLSYKYYEFEKSRDEEEQSGYSYRETIANVFYTLALQLNCKHMEVTKKLLLGKYLIVIDQFDQLRDQLGLLEWFLPYLGNSKLLLISDHSAINIPCVQTLNVSGLDRKFSLIFLKQEGNLQNMQPLSQADDKVLEEIFTVTQGRPLALHLVRKWAALIGINQVLDKMKAIIGDIDNMHRFLHRQIWTCLSREAQQLLIYLGITAVAPISANELNKAGFLSHHDMDKSLSELIDWNLIQVINADSNNNQESYDLHSLTRDFVVSDLSNMHWQECNEYIALAISVRLSMLRCDTKNVNFWDKHIKRDAIANYMKSVADSYEQKDWKTVVLFWQLLAVGLKFSLDCGDYLADLSDYASDACRAILHDLSPTNEESNRWMCISNNIIVNNVETDVIERNMLTYVLFWKLGNKVANKVVQLLLADAEATLKGVQQSLEELQAWWHVLAVILVRGTIAWNLGHMETLNALCLSGIEISERARQQLPWPSFFEEPIGQYSYCRYMDKMHIWYPLTKEEALSVLKINFSYWSMVIEEGKGDASKASQEASLYQQECAHMVRLLGQMGKDPLVIPFALAISGISDGFQVKSSSIDERTIIALLSKYGYSSRFAGWAARICKWPDFEEGSVVAW